jgi:hypothetical protein
MECGGWGTPTSNMLKPTQNIVNPHPIQDPEGPEIQESMGKRTPSHAQDPQDP